MGGVGGGGGRKGRGGGLGCRNEFRTFRKKMI